MTFLQIRQMEASGGSILTDSWLWKSLLKIVNEDAIALVKIMIWCLLWSIFIGPRSDYCIALSLTE